MSTEGWPGPMLPSPTPSRNMDQMSRAEILAWANDAYRSQVRDAATELVNTPDVEFVRTFGIAESLVPQLKAAIAVVRLGRVA